jgi:hypothetical protein
MMALGMFQEIRNNTLTLDRTNISPGGPHEIRYSTNGRAVSGFIFCYDKIYLALGFKSGQQEVAKKGKSNNTNFTIQLRGNKLVIEASYRNYRGFYDENTPAFVIPFNDTTPYYRNESLQNKTFKLKSFYFLNHKKFSYSSAYFGSFRQIKSAASWVLNANFYSTQMRADSTIIPYYAHEVFNPYSNLNSVSVKAFSFGAGASANIVLFKRFYFNATFTIGAEPQWRTYRLVNGENISQAVLSASLDFRSALGYNSKRFFILVSQLNDVTFNNSKTLTFSGNFLSGNLILGYRFHFENKATKALKSNKIYQSL